MHVAMILRRIPAGRRWYTYFHEDRGNLTRHGTQEGEGQVHALTVRLNRSNLVYMGPSDSRLYTGGIEEAFRRQVRGIR